MSNHKFVGFVTAGGLREGLRIRLKLPDDVQEGSFVVTEHGYNIDYGLVTNLQLGATHPIFAEDPLDGRLPGEIVDILNGQTLHTEAEVLNALTLEIGPEFGTQEYNEWRNAIDSGARPHPRPVPIKTLPQHHSKVRIATAGDIAEVFGKPVLPNFVIGHTREHGHPVCINLDRFIQRSSGIFGATGTGKSFLTRIVLAGLIKHDNSSTMVLDMHNGAPRSA